MRPATTKTTGSAALLFMVAIAGLAAQEFQLTLRVDEVLVPFSVRDGDGQTVAGLTRDDFTVLEDDRVQTIAEFSDAPVALSAALLIDTGVRRESLDAIQASIPALVESFSDFDEVAVYRYDNEISRILDFVEEPILLDHDRLREALEKFSDLPATILSTAAEGNRRPPPSPTIGGIQVTPQPTPPQERDRRVLHDAMYTAARDLALRADDRRRIIIVITDGTDERSEIDPEEVHLTLLDADVQVYPIGLNVELFVRFTDSLDDYADITGGRLHYTNRSTLQGTYSDITAEARNQYLVTYVSNNPIPQDRIPFREIEIRSNPGYEINHRFGYYQVP